MPLYSVVISCGNPPVIPNGSRTFTGTTRGDTATYTCDNELGSVIVTCQATGTWDTAPTCPRKSFNTDSLHILGNFQ